MSYIHAASRVEGGRAGGPATSVTMAVVRPSGPARGGTGNGVVWTRRNELNGRNGRTVCGQ